MRGAPVTEVKSTLDGGVQTFACRGLLLTSRLAVIRFDHPGERCSGGLLFPAGSHTLGFFWPRRLYTCYRISGPDGRVIVYRFDVVDRVRIGEGRVSYRDLALDVLVTPDGEARVEDEVEVEAALRSGLISAREHDAITRTRTVLLTRHRRIIAEVERDAESL